MVVAAEKVRTGKEENMARLIKLTPQAPAIPPRLRVAAYARVSKDTEQLMHSLSAQISHYSELIQRTPGWAYAGVYVDAGLTGTSTTARPEFQRLVADCEAGKIDVVLTKSISRFARNTVDLLSTVRHLKSLGIEVRFEREHINSLSADGEVMLSILASFAQEESTSLSNNIKWTFQKKFREGRIHSRHSTLGYRWEGDEMVIVPEEAETVRFIFTSYIGGMSTGEITKELNRRGVKSLTGKTFPQASVVVILQNEQYTGCLLLQRKYNYEPNKGRINRGELPMYRIDNHHPAIISEEQFAAAMAVKVQRGRAATANRRSSNFSGKVWCGECGCKSGSHHTTSASCDPDRLYWVCNKRHNQKGGCISQYVRDDRLHEAAETLDLTLNAIDRVMLYERKIVFTLMNGRTATWKQP